MHVCLPHRCYEDDITGKDKSLADAKELVLFGKKKAQLQSSRSMRGVEITNGFSELGWAALDAFGGEQAQADFINQAATRLTREQGIDLKLFGWAWLHGHDDNDLVAP